MLDAQRALEKVHVADEVSRYMVALVNETWKPEQGPDRGQSARSLALPG